MNPSPAKRNSPAQKISPRQLGYRMPAEWEPHRATWLAWPHNREAWPENQLEQIKEVWVGMVRALAPMEEVCLLVRDEAQRSEATERLRAGGAAMEHLSIYRIPTVDVWARDWGPTFLTKRRAGKELAFNDWIFNAWGGKYESYIEDDTVCKKIAAMLRVPVFEHDIVLEGGAIDVNGCGTCLTTEQCLLNPNRNPHLSRTEIENRLRESLGVDHFIWLGKGLVGDDTDGHIDDIARFVNPTTVVCALEENPRDENYRLLQENYERLQGARDEKGNRLTIAPLPMPGPVVLEGTRLPASYANFYVANGIVLVPTYNRANDRKAMEVLGELFPGRRVIGVPCEALVAGLGAVHCVTQQEPAIHASHKGS